MCPHGLSEQHNNDRTAPTHQLDVESVEADKNSSKRTGVRENSALNLSYYSVLNRTVPDIM